MIDSRIDRERPQHDLEPSSRRLFQIQEQMLPSHDHAWPAGQLAKWFLAHGVAEICGELTGFREKTEGVHTGVQLSTILPRPPTREPSLFATGIEGSDVFGEPRPLLRVGAIQDPRLAPLIAFVLGAA